MLKAEHRNWHIEVLVVSSKSNRSIDVPNPLFLRHSSEKKCRPNLCKSYERCVYSRQNRPVCIVCQYSPRFFSHSGECSMNVATCGDDGVLYKNYCALLRGQCDKSRYIDIIDYETCPKKMTLMSKFC